MFVLLVRKAYLTWFYFRYKIPENDQLPRLPVVSPRLVHLLLVGHGLLQQSKLRQQRERPLHHGRDVPGCGRLHQSVTSVHGRGWQEGPG